MQNLNKTAKRVEKEPSRILQELREHAATHPVFARKMKERGVEFTPDWLKKKASTAAFRGLHGWKRLIPAVAQAAIVQHERAILYAYTDLKGFIVEES